MGTRLLRECLGNHIIRYFAIEIPNKFEIYQLKGGTPRLLGAFPKVFSLLL